MAPVLMSSYVLVMADLIKTPPPEHTHRLIVPLFCQKERRPQESY